jgi:hypothetical protein
MFFRETFRAVSLAARFDWKNSMKTHVRDATYETNSSSSHSVTVAEGDIFDRFFQQQSIRDGRVQLRNITDLCQQDEWMRLYVPENILSFLIVSEIEDGFYTNKENSFRDDLEALMPNVYNQMFDILPIIRANFLAVEDGLCFLEKEYKIEFELKVVTGPKPYFETNNLAAAVGHFGDVQALKRLLFNSQSYVELTPENAWSLPPHEMATDTGETYITPNYDELLQQFDDNLKSFTQRMEEMADARKKDTDQDQ